MNSPLWQPSEAYIESSVLKQFERYLAENKQLTFTNYHDFWAWSTTHPADFWAAITAFFGIKFHSPYAQVLERPAEGMIGTKWFTGSTLNYAEHIFAQATDERPAIVFQAENAEMVTISWAELTRRTLAVQQFLVREGVQAGDRIAGYLTNSPEAIYIFLAANSLGAIWSCCSPDFGTDSVIDRFRQIEPKLLFATKSYSYNGKRFDKSDMIKELSDALPTLEETVVIDSLRWKSLLANVNERQPLTFTPVAFEHPIWILYSSGTTGKPKAITHGTGGILIEHLKALALHQNVQAGERFFWYSTTGWMMWNYALSSLLCGATLCLYDGSANYPEATALWRFAEAAAVNHFGAGAAFYIAAMNAETDLSGFQLSLKTVGSTGSPLPPAAFAWLYTQLPDMQLISLSGGTDVCSAFLSGCPYLPVYSGEIQCRTLGSAIAAYDENGKPVEQQVGELVIEQPMPSMPVFFWNDPDNERYRSSYFEKYSGIWCHGDWIKLTEHDGVIVYGRSDATLNRGGVRIGTAEVYNAVGAVDGIKDSLVVSVEREDGTAYMPLYVVLMPDIELTDALKKNIVNALRTQYSPRHVPDEIIAVPDIPYTLSGKKMEIPVKKLLQGYSPEKAVTLDAMRNPEAIRWWITEV